MATTSLWAIRADGKRSTAAVIKKLTDYAENEEKTTEQEDQAASNMMVTDDDRMERIENVIHYVSDKNEGMQFVTGVNCSEEHVAEEMLFTRSRFHSKGNRVLYHGYQSFLPGEVTPEQAHRIGVSLSEQLWGDRFEVLVATHLDRDHLHNHFVINAISFLDGKKFRWDTEYPRMKKLSDEICTKESLSVITDPKNEGGHHQGTVRANREGRCSITSIVLEDVDCCIEVANSFHEFEQLLKEKGYQLDFSHKYLRIIPPGRKAIRIDRRFGADYSVEGITKRIKEHGEYQMTEEDIPFGSMADPPDPAERKAMQDAVERLTEEKTSATELKGIQIIYIRFMLRIGYPTRSKGKIARTHYLLREELIKLDRYIEESRLLIREGIRTESELACYMEKRKTNIQELQQEQKNLRNRIRRSASENADEYRKHLSEVGLLLDGLRCEIRIGSRISNRMKFVEWMSIGENRKNTLYSHIQDRKRRDYISYSY